MEGAEHDSNSGSARTPALPRVTTWVELCALHGLPNHRKTLFQIGELVDDDIRAILANLASHSEVRFAS